MDVLSAIDRTPMVTLTRLELVGINIGYAIVMSCCKRSLLNGVVVEDGPEIVP